MMRLIMGLHFVGGLVSGLIQQQSERPSRVLLAFAEELMDTRRMIETSNTTNIRLALERLFYLWQQVCGRLQRQTN